MDEKCMFQQNYNIYGIEDKPCCYLFHKYCEEVDDCYFKQLQRLKQENEQLCEDNTRLGNNLDCANDEIHNLHNILEEIKNILNTSCGIFSNSTVVGMINEVLDNEQLD